MFRFGAKLRTPLSINAHAAYASARAVYGGSQSHLQLLLRKMDESTTCLARRRLTLTLQA
jgi:hypothetical protein